MLSSRVGQVSTETRGVVCVAKELYFKLYATTQSAFKQPGVVNGYCPGPGWYNTHWL